MKNEVIFVNFSFSGTVQKQLLKPQNGITKSSNYYILVIPFIMYHYMSCTVDTRISESMISGLRLIQYLFAECLVRNLP